jgi:hypothetical protein
VWDGFRMAGLHDAWAQIGADNSPI